MPFLGTLENIDTAIANLNLKEGTLKAQFIFAIRSYFVDQESLDTITAIPADDLIQKIWAIDDPKEIQNKRKNLSGLKSSVNKSLKDLISADKNPDGIIVGRDNTFTIAEEQKDQLIKQLGITTESLHSMHEMLNSFRELLTDMSTNQNLDGARSLIEKLDQTQQLMQQVAAAGAVIPSEPPQPEAETLEVEETEIVEVCDDDTEILTVDDHDLIDAEELEEIYEEELPAHILTDRHALDPGDDAEVIEIGEGDEIETVDDFDTDAEEPGGDAEIVEIDAEDEIETVDGIDADAIEPRDDAEIVEIDAEDEIETVDDFDTDAEEPGGDAEIVEIDAED
ncbi:MAG: hypothetical protein OEV73_09975, partial [Desulfobulbaceae bacterium]|nr:hypothetical protein [Desulfobulbaceae bacterium]